MGITLQASGPAVCWSRSHARCTRAAAPLPPVLRQRVLAAQREAVGREPPYVLVGHSVGGPLVRLYAHSGTPPPGGVDDEQR